MTLSISTSAKGENVANDLVKSGLVNSSFYDWSCPKIQEELKSQAELAAWNAIARCGIDDAKRCLLR
ncbi:hypothetical protein BH18THE1_BH18THE1_18330 [soil metagenome]